MIAAILLTAVAQLAPLPYADLISNTARRARFESARQTLARDESLMQLHRGYTGFLESHPDIAQTEFAYQEALRNERFRARIRSFEEALLKSPEAIDRFNDFNQVLHEVSSVAANIQRLRNIESRNAQLGPAFAYLKRNPAVAKIFLKSPHKPAPTPRPLYPMRERFRSDPDFHAKVREALKPLLNGFVSNAPVLSWWAIAHDPETDLGQALASLDSDSRITRQQHQAWRARNAAWSKYPEARDWSNYVLTRVRRHSSLRDTYFDYLATRRQYPDIDEAEEQNELDTYGALPTWPPRDAPPEIEPLKDTSISPTSPTRPTRPTREGLRPKRPTPPDRGSQNLPTRPERPSTTRPSASSPERDTPQ